MHIINGGTSMSEQFRLARKWWILYIAATVLIGVALLELWIITWPAIKAEQLGQPLPAHWTWVSIIAVDIGILCMTGILCGGLLFDLLTVFTEEGIKKPGLFGLTFIRWAEVTEVVGYIPKGMIVLEIRSPDKKIRINVLYYRDQNQLVSLIREYVPSSAKWSEWN